MSNQLSIARPNDKNKPETKEQHLKYWSCFVASGGGVGFDDTTLAGLLEQSQDFVDGYPVGRGDYTSADREDNVRVIWAIMENRPSSVDDEHGIGFCVGHC